ncbi:hypothetical protein ACDA63_05530 [Uliginosibacterium sp. sgz301328]|uniref:hypothetical protein n=1 Tax=Uliginosibacterium sp. sgz301328 TaxID=3243764 RepID=UPI00359E7B79
MTKHWFARGGIVLLLSAAALSAQARIYPIAADAQRADMEVTGNGIVSLNGKAYNLSPAAQIRDANDRLLLTQSMSGKYPVRVTFDGQGNVIRVWVLSPEEAKARTVTPASQRP